MQSDDEDPRNGHFLMWVGRIAIGLLTTGIIGLIIWNSHVSGVMSGVERDLQALRRDITALQSGSTIPMAAETRATFQSVFDRLGRIEQAVDRVATQVDRERE